MPTQVLTNARVQWGTGTGDVLQNVRSVTLTYEAEALDDTTMGDTTRQNLGGLKNWSAEVEIHQTASGTTSSHLFPLVGTIRNLKVRADTGSVGPANPEFRGDALLTSFPIFGAAVGELSGTSISFAPAGTLSRATS